MLHTQLCGLQRATSSRRPSYFHNRVQRPANVCKSKRRVIKVAGLQQGSTSASLSNIKQQFQIKDVLKPLFEPLKLGRIELQHRIFMAPLTRNSYDSAWLQAQQYSTTMPDLTRVCCNRAPDNVPARHMGTYYSQRATPGGLLITEATCISQQARGYPNTPGVWSAEQVDGWKPIVQQVKEKGTHFFCQLWHGGRASHEDFQPDGGLPVGPSEVRISDAFKIYTPKGGPFKYPTPRALDASELPGIVKEYADAARSAVEAGFDGIEFWKDSSNKRTDEYGGSDENKARLLLEVMEAVADAVGADRCGVRLSPYNQYLDAQDTVERAVEKNVWLMKELDRRVPGLAYIHMVEPRIVGHEVLQGHIDHTLNPFRQATSRPFLAAGGFKRDTAIAAITKAEADAVVFGRLYLANPDLVKRLAVDAPLNKYDRNTFYAMEPADMKGYTDYPFLEE